MKELTIQILEGPTLNGVKTEFTYNTSNGNLTITLTDKNGKFINWALPVKVTKNSYSQ